jgi:hypothetical protein
MLCMRAARDVIILWDMRACGTPGTNILLDPVCFIPAPSSVPTPDSIFTHPANANCGGIVDDFQQGQVSINILRMQV